MARSRLEREGPRRDRAEALERHPLGDRGEAVQDQPPLRGPVAEQARRREQPVPEPDPVEVDRHGRSMPRRSASITRRRRAAGGAASRWTSSRPAGPSAAGIPSTISVAPAATIRRACTSARARPGGIRSREHLADELERRRVAARVLERADDEVPLGPEVVVVAGLGAGEQPALGGARREPDPARALPAEEQRRAARGQRRGQVRRAAERVVRVVAGHAREGRRPPGRTAPGSCPPRTPCARSARRWAAARCRTGRAPPRTSRRRARGRTFPPVTWSRTVAAFATSTGWRNVFESTACPTRMPGHVVDERREQGHRLERGPGRDRVHVGDVVVHPAAVERGRTAVRGQLAGVAPRRVEVGPVDALGRGLERDPEGHRDGAVRRRCRRCGSRASGAAGRRW